MPETDASGPRDASESAGAHRLTWQVADVLDVIAETPRVSTLILNVPGWRKQLPGQYVDVRLTGEDGYQAQRLYSIASEPEAPHLAITVERIDDGEVSPYLAGELRRGDRFELRGPIGGYFVWTVDTGGPLFLIGGGSGIVPLMAMLRHRAAAANAAAAVAAASSAAASAASAPPAPPIARLLYSSRSVEDIIYREELDRLAAKQDGLSVIHTLTRRQPPGWTGPARRIDRAMLADAAFSPDEHPHIYICGPTSLVESAAHLLIDLGHDPVTIKTERFGPTGA
jgi:ferredoxin-NADP reductase